MNDVIEQLGQSMHQLPEIYEPALSHYQAQGLYGRRIYVPAGVCVVTMVHKQEHFTVALKGRCRVVNEQGQEAIVEAPAVFVTQPGTQRACYAETDVEWLTVHAVSEIRDITRMRDVLCCNSMAEYEQLNLLTQE